IAPIVDRSPEAARQLASRARRRVRGGAAALATDVARKREVVSAFFTASRTGDFNALLAVVAPDVVLRADPVAVRTAAANKGAGEHGLAPETPLAAAAAVLESLALGILFVRYSLELTATNPLCWVIGMGLVAAFVAYGRYALRPLATPSKVRAKTKPAASESK